MFPSLLSFHRLTLLHIFHFQMFFSIFLLCRALSSFILPTVLNVASLFVLTLHSLLMYFNYLLLLLYELLRFPIHCLYFYIKLEIHSVRNPLIVHSWWMHYRNVVLFPTSQIVVFLLIQMQCFVYHLNHLDSQIPRLHRKQKLFCLKIWEILFFLVTLH